MLTAVYLVAQATMKPRAVYPGEPLPEFAVRRLLRTPVVTISDVCCQGGHRQPSEEECATATQLVFPYRGVYVRHLGHD